MNILSTNLGGLRLLEIFGATFVRTSHLHSYSSDLLEATFAVPWDISRTDIPASRLQFDLFTAKTNMLYYIKCKQCINISFKM